MTNAAATRRWDFTPAHPIVKVRASYELSAEGIRFDSDAPFGAQGPAALRWDAIAEAATATLDLPGSQTGPSPPPAALAARLEWLLLSRSDRPERAFMRVLPSGSDRDALVAELRERLGSKWVGERMPLDEARKRLRIAEHSDGIDTVGLVIGALLLIVIIVVVGVLLLTVLLLPALFAFGAWLFQRGLSDLRAAIAIENLPTSSVSSAAIGLVELAGRAVADNPSPAGASGTPSVWWDVGVDAWYRDGDNRGGGEWRQIAAQHGGDAGLLVVEDDTGRVPVWPRDADLILRQHTWHSTKDTLPAPGQALLAGAGIAWDRSRNLRVREQRIEAGGALYVMGTLAEVGSLPQGERDSGLARWRRAMRTGTWKASVLRVTPSLLKAPLAVAFVFFGMFGRLGSADERSVSAQDAPPPALPADGVLVWKGRSGRAFIIADAPETGSLERVRARSLWRLGLGAVLMCYVLYELGNTI